jgi:hypothetical protein
MPVHAFVETVGVVHDYVRRPRETEAAITSLCELLELRDTLRERDLEQPVSVFLVDQELRDPRVAHPTPKRAREVAEDERRDVAPVGREYILARVTRQLPFSPFLEGRVAEAAREDLALPQDGGKWNVSFSRSRLDLAEECHGGTVAPGPACSDAEAPVVRVLVPDDARRGWRRRAGQLWHG